MNDVLSTSTSTSTSDFDLDFDNPDRYLAIGDDEVAYWRAGSGPDLVLVHGWPLHAATWRYLVPALAPHFTCHLIDLPGAGKTRSPSHRRVSLGKHARTVQAVIEELGIERCAFVAHDSGAAITRIVAAELGERIWATVMGNTEIPGHRPWLIVLFGLLGRIGGPKAFSAVLAQRWLRHSYLGFGTCFADTDLIEGAFYDLFVRPLVDDVDTMRGQLRLLDGFDWADIDHLDETHQRITGPVALLWGENDPYFPLHKARRMRFPGGTTLHVLRGMKLFAHEENHEEFAAHALAFLGEHAPSA